MLSLPSDKYRPDIDGLRAVAVLLVVAFHAFRESWPGGFIGVDIFFVISGFLITGLIARELAEQRFSLLTFYARRAMRPVIKKPEITKKMSTPMNPPGQLSRKA